MVLQENSMMQYFHLCFSVLIQSNASALLALWEHMRVEVRDKTSLRYLNKLRDNLLKINPDYTGKDGELGRGITALACSSTN